MSYFPYNIDAQFPFNTDTHYHNFYQQTHDSDTASNFQMMFPNQETQIAVGVHPTTNTHLHFQEPNNFQQSQISDPNTNFHMMFPNPEAQIATRVHPAANPTSFIGSSSNPEQQQVLVQDNPNNFQQSQVFDPITNFHMMFPNPEAQIATRVHPAAIPTSFIGSSSNSEQQQVLDHDNSIALQMGYQDAWRVCHPDYKHPFTSLEDACERLLPYHVVADYEEDNDDKVLDSGEMMTRSQQWDTDISTKVSEYTTIFEKQVDMFNIISNKQSQGELRTEERLMIENLLLQDEKQALSEARVERKKSRKRAGRRTPMVHSQADLSAHPEMVLGESSHGSQHTPEQVTATRWGSSEHGEAHPELMSGGVSLGFQTIGIPIQLMPQQVHETSMTNAGWSNNGHGEAYPGMMYGEASIGSPVIGIPIQLMPQQVQTTMMTSVGWGNRGYGEVHPELMFGETSLGSQAIGIPIQLTPQQVQATTMNSIGWGNNEHEGENGEAAIWQDE